MKKSAFSSPGKAGSPGGGVGFFQQFTRQPLHPTAWRSRWTAIARNSPEKSKAVFVRVAVATESGPF